MRLAQSRGLGDGRLVYLARLCLVLGAEAPNEIAVVISPAIGDANGVVIELEKTDDLPGGHLLGVPIRQVAEGGERGGELLV